MKTPQRIAGTMFPVSDKCIREGDIIVTPDADAFKVARVKHHDQEEELVTDIRCVDAVEIALNYAGPNRRVYLYLRSNGSAFVVIPSHTRELSGAGLASDSSPMRG